VLFNSFDFFLFFLILLFLYWSSPHRYKWIILLFFSYIFYLSWIPAYALILLLSTLIDYFLNTQIINSVNKDYARKGLILSILTNLILLFTFKYFDFFNILFVEFFRHFNVSYNPPRFNLLLPLGISFYTFQKISYSIDVYQSRILPENNFGKFALYVCFFPQLIAGPIERARHLLPQLNKKQFQLNPDKISRGLFLIFWGLFLKVVIADNIEPIVNHIYGSANYQSGGGVLYGSILFTFQIYGDFCGYSCIALGIGALLDIELKANFHSPFYSHSLSEFWKRWHITLSEWFKDYVYIPKGGNRNSIFKVSVLIFFIFLISGLWHGATINHIIWGLGHGFFMIIERISNLHKEGKNQIFNYLRMFIIFGIVTLLFIPFRADNIELTLTLFEKLRAFHWSDFYFWMADNRYKNYIFGIVILLIYDFFHRKQNSLDIVPKKILSRAYSISFLMLLIILLGSSGGKQFIYFQF
jgi:alginate O-acetyltransferase complex protein AlgI